MCVPCSNPFPHATQSSIPADRPNVLQGVGSCFSLPRPIVKLRSKARRHNCQLSVQEYWRPLSCLFEKEKLVPFPYPLRWGRRLVHKQSQARYLHLYLGNANPVVVNFRIVCLAIKRGALRNRATKPSSVMMHRILATCPLRANRQHRQPEREPGSSI
jgi:hypothetical protein